MRRAYLLFLLIPLFLIIPWNSAHAEAVAEQSTVISKNAQAQLNIKDPITEQTWEWKIPIQVSISPEASLLNNTSEKKIEAKFNLRDYINESLRATGAQQTLNDDIIVVAGMYYNTNSRNQIAITSVYGSTTPRNNLFYATNRAFYWRHFGTNGGGTYYPTSNSWSYPGDNKYDYCAPSLPIKAITDCTINVAGMNTKRNVSVTCSLC